LGSLLNSYLFIDK